MKNISKNKRSYLKMLMASAANPVKSLRTEKN